MSEVIPFAAGGYRVVTGGEQPGAITCRRVVNSAGLHAQAVARGIEGLEAPHIPKQTLAKGNYYSFTGRPAFTHLIYPAPVEGGLGVEHAGLDVLVGDLAQFPGIAFLEEVTTCVSL